MRGLTVDYTKAAAAIGKLRELVDERTNAVTALSTIDSRIDVAALEADQAGVQVTEIADVLGISRQSTHRILLRVRPKDE